MPRNKKVTDIAQRLDNGGLSRADAGRVRRSLALSWETEEAGFHLLFLPKRTGERSFAATPWRRASAPAGPGWAGTEARPHGHGAAARLAEF